MNTADVIARVRACNEARLRDIHEATKVPLPTLAKLRYGVTVNPRGTTVDALREYFQRATDREAA